MKKKRKSKIPAAVLAAAATLVIGSAVVVAAARYLTPGQIAERHEDQKLTEAFQGEDAVLVSIESSSGSTPPSHGQLPSKLSQGTPPVRRSSQAEKGGSSTRRPSTVSKYPVIISPAPSLPDR